VGDQIKLDEIGGAYSMHGRHEKFIQNFGQKLDHTEDIGVYLRISE